MRIQHISISEANETTIKFDGVRDDLSKTFLVGDGANTPFYPFPGATVVVNGTVATVTVPAQSTHKPEAYNFNNFYGSVEFVKAPPVPTDMATQAELDTAVAPKANTTDVNTALAAKADTTAVDTALAAKANTTDVNTALGTKANAADIGIKPVNTVTAAYTLAATDVGKVVELNSATAAAVTVPANATVAIPVGAVVTLRQYGAGNLTVAAEAGVTILSAGGALRLSGQYAEATLTKRAVDEWVLAGNIAV